MSFEFIRKLPSPTEIKAEFPVPEKTAALKAERDKEIADVITGKSDKFLAIIVHVRQITKMPFLIIHSA